MLFPSGELLFISAGYAASIIVGLGFGLFVLLQEKRGSAHIAFFLMCSALALFQISFLLGSNTPPSSLAYAFWFANIVDVFLAIFYLQFIILALDALPRFRLLLGLDYIAGLAILGLAFLFPPSFLPQVAPKLYFESYLAGGPLYGAMLAFFLLSFLASFAVMFLERAGHGEEGRRRIEYYIFSLFYGFVTGITAFPLVFNFPVDPIASMLIGTFTIPMVYGMIKKDLLDIRLVVRRTLFFTLAIAGTTGILLALSLASQYLAPIIPGFFYAVPLIAALAAVGVGTLYWRKAQEAEKVKYEFLTVVAHKFRTPLTRIRWAAEALKEEAGLSPTVSQMVGQILEADLSLIQLANLLIDTVRTEHEAERYSQKNIDLAQAVESAAAAYRSTAFAKHLTLVSSTAPSLPLVSADPERLTSAIGVMIENAIAYTPSGGRIELALSGSSDEVRFSVRDTGIGIDEHEAPYLFTKFYRGDAARKADTEGVGVGLNLAKSIIEHERGTIGAHSEGRGKGSEFWFTLPAAKV